MLMPHWDYFRTVESDLERSLRYVECDEANYGTYSLEFARLIMASCAEIDTVCKQLCRHICPDSSPPPKRIPAYAKCILAKHALLPHIEIKIARYGKVFRPWQHWTEANCPRWWTAYNHIKHSRTEHFCEATLRNAIESTAGLMTVVLYLYSELNGGALRPIPDSYGPRLFDIEVEESPEWSGDSGVFWGYRLPGCGE